MRIFCSKRRHYFEVMLNRLVESDRLNEDESDALWERIKDDVEKKFDDVIDGNTALTLIFEVSAAGLAEYVRFFAGK